jgi:hypothetical protein
MIMRALPTSTRALAATQASRAAALPLAAQKDPLRLGLEGFRQRNALLDALFYDVRVVTPAEAIRISPWLASEGAILIVPPSNGKPLTLCTSLDEFAEFGSDIEVLAVAGVGSSALGAAAFARNLADAFGAPVAAVVSGYGLSDLATEALGGLFMFGALNGLRHAFEQLDNLARTVGLHVMAELDTPFADVARASKDTKAVFRLLTDDRFRFRVLSGHSKGNLVISEALYELQEQAPARADELANRTAVVTFSAKIAMPRRFAPIVDVMGGLDWFGQLNSRPGIDTEYLVSGAWHHTNTELAAHLPVTKTMRKVLDDKRLERI